MSATSPARGLTERLLRALDADYNVVDARAVERIVSELERFEITKELLEATRLGKHVNELRRKTGDPALARRTKLLVKRWRDLVIPDRGGADPRAPVADGRSNRPFAFSRTASPASRAAAAALEPEPEPRRLRPDGAAPSGGSSPIVATDSPAGAPLGDRYDSDSQDVIIVDGVVDDDSSGNRRLFAEAPTEKHAGERRRSPANGDPADGRKRTRRESGGGPGGKAKRRRNRDASDDRSLGSVSIGSPFASIGSASTSPALRNGLAVRPPPVVSLIVDDPDDGSSASVPEPKPESSRRNGCKRPTVDADDYSNFIKSKIPTGGRRVKTTRELLEDVRAKKSGKPPAARTPDGRRTPKRDFLAAYDSKKSKKETPVVTDIIELNDSNSGSRPEGPSEPNEAKADLRTDGERTRFETVEAILSRLPPLDVDGFGDGPDAPPACACVDDLDPDPDCPAERRSVRVNDSLARTVHDVHVADVNGSACEPRFRREPPLACRTSSWGLRPYYDCSRDLFLDVVPKYNFLDYSLDRCVKNLSNITLEKYEPARTVPDSTEWFLNLEKEFFERWKTKNDDNDDDDDGGGGGGDDDDYETAADSPFSEEDGSETLDSDKNERESGSGGTPPADDDGESCSFFNFTGYGLIARSRSCRRTFPIELFDCDASPDTPAEIRVEADPDASFGIERGNAESNFAPFVPKNTRKFTYEDAVSLLPLSMSALNGPGDVTSSGDLSCVFRTATAPDEDRSSREPCDLSYSLVQNANIIEMKDISCANRKRTRDVVLSDHDEDANCDSDVKKLDLADGSANREKCVKNGCPSWIPGSVPPNAFREWHEPVLRSSHNGESLTILPYVVID